jgi:hypothetical protein
MESKDKISFRFNSRRGSSSGAIRSIWDGLRRLSWQEVLCHTRFSK